MPRVSRLLTRVALRTLVIASGACTARPADVSTPTAGAGDATSILIERADLVTELDLGEPGRRWEYRESVLGLVASCAPLPRLVRNVELCRDLERIG